MPCGVMQYAAMNGSNPSSRPANYSTPLSLKTISVSDRARLLQGGACHVVNRPYQARVRRHATISAQEESKEFVGCSKRTLTSTKHLSESVKAVSDVTSVKNRIKNQPSSVDGRASG